MEAGQQVKATHLRKLYKDQKKRMLRVLAAHMLDPTRGLRS